MAEMLRYVHHGEILLAEFLKPMGISQNRLAKDIGVPPRRINEIVLMCSDERLLKVISDKAYTIKLAG